MGLNSIEGRNYRFVITGGPGSGKSSLIRALAKSGYIIYPDIARHLMESGMDAPINMVDTSAGKQFSQLVMEERIQQHLAGEGSRVCFYDRGLSDSIGFINHLGLKPPAALKEAITKYRYNNNIFILPPWKDIYVQDKIRKEDFKTASLIHGHIRSAYLEAGYDLISIPQVPLEKRLHFVLDKIAGLDLLGNKPVSE